jgi:hypothetical protein
MFSKSYEIARQYTKPVIISSRTLDKKVDCGGGAFVILNNEGWIITVAHLFETNLKRQNDQPLIAKYEQDVKEIEEDPKLKSHTKTKKISKLHKDIKWITIDSYWWGGDGIHLSDVKIFPEIDLAVGRLDPFSPDIAIKYPKIKNPDELNPGTSLCKLGFPFHQITGTFDEQKSTFVLSPGALPLPLFPIEGILTRFRMNGKTSDGKYDKQFIETSSPGLRGQSGGAIFDTNATVWGIQSYTDHLPLGFSPKILKNGKEIEENQFINVGCGVHPNTIVQVLTDHGIKFELA